MYPAPAIWTVPGCTGDRCTLTNYDGQGQGDTSLRQAMHASINTVFAELIVDVSVQDTVSLARALGFSRFDPAADYGPSVALGAVETSPLEMASAYGTFATRGVRVPPIGVQRVVDGAGNVLIDNSIGRGVRVLSDPVADHVTDVLLGVVPDGIGARAAVRGHTIAGKTGTAQEYRAAWFVGYTTSVVTAVWMGHADGLASLRDVNGIARVTGGSHPAVAFADVMSAVLAGSADEVFPFPVPLEVIAEQAADVPSRRREETVLGARRQPVELPADCGGPCRRTELVDPLLPVTTLPAVPPTTTTTTTTVASSFPPGATSSTSSTSSTDRPPATTLRAGDGD